MAITKKVLLCTAVPIAGISAASGIGVGISQAIRASSNNTVPGVDNGFIPGNGNGTGPSFGGSDGSIGGSMGGFFPGGNGNGAINPGFPGGDGGTNVPNIPGFPGNGGTVVPGIPGNNGSTNGGTNAGGSTGSVDNNGGVTVGPGTTSPQVSTSTIDVGAVTGTTIGTLAGAGLLGAGIGVLFKSLRGRANHPDLTDGGIPLRPSAKDTVDGIVLKNYKVNTNGDEVDNILRTTAPEFKLSEVIDKDGNRGAFWLPKTWFNPKGDLLSSGAVGSEQFRSFLQYLGENPDERGNPNAAINFMSLQDPEGPVSKMNTKNTESVTVYKVSNTQAANGSGSSTSDEDEVLKYIDNVLNDNWEKSSRSGSTISKATVSTKTGLAKDDKWENVDKDYLSIGSSISSSSASSKGSTFTFTSQDLKILEGTHEYNVDTGSVHSIKLGSNKIYDETGKATTIGKTDLIYFLNDINNGNILVDGATNKTKGQARNLNILTQLINGDEEAKKLLKLSPKKKISKDNISNPFDAVATKYLMNSNRRDDPTSFNLVNVSYWEKGQMKTTPIFLPDGAFSAQNRAETVDALTKMLSNPNTKNDPSAYAMSLIKAAAVSPAVSEKSSIVPQINLVGGFNEYASIDNDYNSIQLIFDNDKDKNKVPLKDTDFTIYARVDKSRVKALSPQNSIGSSSGSKITDDMKRRSIASLSSEAPSLPPRPADLLSLSSATSSVSSVNLNAAQTAGLRVGLMRSLNSAKKWSSRLISRVTSTFNKSVLGKKSTSVSSLPGLDYAWEGQKGFSLWNKTKKTPSSSSSVSRQPSRTSSVSSRRGSRSKYNSFDPMAYKTITYL